MGAAGDEQDETVSEQDLKRLQDAYPHDPEKGVDSAESLNKPSDPSLNRGAPAAKEATGD